MQATDIDTVLALLADAALSAWTPQQVLDSLSSDFDTSYLLQDGDSVIGYAVIHSVLDESEVLNIVIRKASQAQGFGTFFLRHLLEILKHQGQRIIHLEVRVSNSSAIRLYEKIGFQQVGLRKEYYPAAGSLIDREDALLYSLSVS